MKINFDYAKPGLFYRFYTITFARNVVILGKMLIRWDIAHIVKVNIKKIKIYTVELRSWIENNSRGYYSRKYGLIKIFLDGTKLPLWSKFVILIRYIFFFSRKHQNTRTNMQRFETCQSLRWKQKFNWSLFEPKWNYWVGLEHYSWRNWFDFVSIFIDC